MRLFLIGIGIVIASGVVYFVAHSPAPDPAATVAPEASLPQSAREVPPGYREYRHAFYRFSLLYPESLIVTEYREPGTKLTLAFEGEEQSFQVHILPYGDSQITERRLALDIPSGEFKNPVDVVIGGVRSTMFESSDITLGPTREVWFIANGFLYEITSPIEHDAWLSEIVRSWQFLD